MQLLCAGNCIALHMLHHRVYQALTAHGCTTCLGTSTSSTAHACMCAPTASKRTVALCLRASLPLGHVLHVRAQFSAVKDACCEYMRACLDDASAAATLSLAAKFSCDEVCQLPDEGLSGKEQIPLAPVQYMCISIIASMLLRRVQRNPETHPALDR